MIIYEFVKFLRRVLLTKILFEMSTKTHTCSKICLIFLDVFIKQPGFLIRYKLKKEDADVSDTEIGG